MLIGKNMSWKIEEAKQKFSELIDAVIEEPQLIYDQNHLVAAVVKADVFQEFLVWQQRQNSSLATAFAELRQICDEENYQLEILPRRDRLNPFAEGSHDFSL
jgi:PHD/YefM family antitoxin component YafN of YafNO toxin-antitoxin module